MNASGMLVRPRVVILDTLSPKRRDVIARTLLRTAIDAWDRESASFEIDLRGQTSKAGIRDTWDGGMELSIRVEIGKRCG